MARSQRNWSQLSRNAKSTKLISGRGVSAEEQVRCPVSPRSLQLHPHPAVPEQPQPIFGSGGRST